MRRMTISRNSNHLESKDHDIDSIQEKKSEILEKVQRLLSKWLRSATVEIETPILLKAGLRFSKNWVGKTYQKKYRLHPSLNGLS
jgi:hypothetical protein